MPVAIVFALVFCMAEPIKEYGILVSQILKKQSLYMRDTFKVVDYIKRSHNGNLGKIFFLNNHIGYWLLDKKPLTRIATHPSNIYREYLYPYVEYTHKNPYQEINYIMDTLRPDIIVSRRIDTSADRIATIMEDNPEQLYLERKVLKEYKTDSAIGSVVVWTRKSKSF